MDEKEFEGWSKVTKASEVHWILDAVTYHNRGAYLFYKGGVDGVFVKVMPDGATTAGTYVGALPHIGEAMFKIEWTKQLGAGALKLAAVPLPDDLLHLVRA